MNKSIFAIATMALMSLSSVAFADGVTTQNNLTTTQFISALGGHHCGFSSCQDYAPGSITTVTPDGTKITQHAKDGGGPLSCNGKFGWYVEIERTGGDNWCIPGSNSAEFFRSTGVVETVPGSTVVTPACVSDHKALAFNGFNNWSITTTINTSAGSCPAR